MEGNSGQGVGGQFASTKSNSICGKTKFTSKVDKKPFKKSYSNYFKKKVK